MCGGMDPNTLYVMVDHKLRNYSYFVENVSIFSIRVLIASIFHTVSEHIQIYTSRLTVKFYFLRNTVVIPYRQTHNI